MIRFILLILISASSLQAYSLYLEPVARVTARVTVGDIGRTEGNAPTTQVLFESVQEPYFLSKEDVARMLKPAPQTIFGVGTWVLPLTRKIEKQEITSGLTSAISKLTGGNDFFTRHRIEVETDSIDTAPQGVGIQYRLPARASALSVGQRTIAVDLVVPDNGRDKTLHRQFVQVRIFKKTRVPVATRDLNPGDVITAADFRLETIETDTDIEKYASDSPVGLRVLAGISAGKPLMHSAVQKLSAIRRGQQLGLVYQTGGIVLRCKSVALSEGDIGSRIDVRILLPSGKKTDIKKADVVSETTATLVP